MREPTIARNYADALFLVGERHGETERYAEVLTALAIVVETNEAVRVMLESPRVSKPVKQRILDRALRGLAPEPFRRFLGAVIKRGRQGLLRAIAGQYASLVDEKMHRIPVGVTLAREPDAGLRHLIQQRLTTLLAKEAIPAFRADPAILGGMVIRVGDRIMDGSLRRRIVNLRRQMLNG